MLLQSLSVTITKKVAQRGGREEKQRWLMILQQLLLLSMMITRNTGEAKGESKGRKDKKTEGKRYLRRFHSFSVSGSIESQLLV